MNDVKEMRKQVKKYVDNADDITVKMIHAMLEVQQEDDWWDQLPSKQKKDIDTAIQQLDEGQGIPHEIVKKTHPQWFVK